MPLTIITYNKKPTDGYVQLENTAIPYRPRNLISKITLNPDGTNGPQVELSGEVRHDQYKLQALNEYLKKRNIPFEIVENEKNYDRYFNIVIPWDIFREHYDTIRRGIPDYDFDEKEILRNLLKEKPSSISEMFAKKIRAAKEKEEFDNILRLARYIRSDQATLQEQYNKQFDQPFEANAEYVLANEIFKLQGQSPFFHTVYMEALLSDSRFFHQGDFLRDFIKKTNNNNPKFLETLLQEVSKIEGANSLHREITLRILSMDKNANAQLKFLEKLFEVNKAKESKQGEVKTEHKNAKDNIVSKEAKGIDLKEINQRVEEAMAHTRDLAKEDKNAWFVLGNFLKDNKLFYPATKAFTQVPKDQMGYSEAQLHCANIYSQDWQLIATMDPNFQLLDEEESKARILEEALRFAARAKDPETASMIYFQLIGKEFSVEPGSQQRAMFESLQTPTTVDNVEAVIEGSRITRELRAADQAKIRELETQRTANQARIKELEALLQRQEAKAVGVAVKVMTQTGTAVGQPLPQGIPSNQQTPTGEPGAPKSDQKLEPKP